MIKLFVGGLPYSIDNQKLNEMFAAFGQVISANVIIDRTTNQSKGFGFVEMSDEAAAQQAIKALDGSEVEGRRLGVSIAKPREETQNDWRGSGDNFLRGSNRR